MCRRKFLKTLLFQGMSEKVVVPYGNCKWRVVIQT